MAHRYKVSSLYNPFVSSFWLVFVLMTIIGLFLNHASKGEVEDVTRDRSDLVMIETGHVGSIVDIGTSTCYSTVRTMLRQKPEWDLKAVFGFATVAGLQGEAASALRSLGPAVNVDQYRPLLVDGCQQRLQELSTRYPVLEAFRGTVTPSKDVVIPEVRPVFAGGVLPLGWVLFSALFTALAIVHRKPRNTHLLRHAPWNQPVFLLMVLCAAPIAVPALAVYGVISAWWHVLHMEIPITTLAERFVRAARTIGYRTRLLRKLPPPYHSPIDRSGEAVARADAEDPHRWYALDPQDTLGREHLLQGRHSVLPWHITAPINADTFLVHKHNLWNVREELGLNDPSLQEIRTPTDVATVTLLELPGDVGTIEIGEDVPVEHVPMLTRVLEAVSEGSNGEDIQCSVHGIANGFQGLRVRLSLNDDSDDVAETPAIYDYTRANGAPIRLVKHFNYQKEWHTLVKDWRGQGVAVVCAKDRSIWINALLLGLDEPWVPNALARILYDAIYVIEKTRVATAVA